MKVFVTRTWGKKYKVTFVFPHTGKRLDGKIRTFEQIREYALKGDEVIDRTGTLRSLENYNQMHKKNPCGSSKRRNPGPYTLKFRSVKNYDYDMPHRQGYNFKETHPVKNLQQAKAIFNSLIYDNDMGGGNLAEASVYKGKTKIGEFSYNGRFWRTGRSKWH